MLKKILVFIAVMVIAAAIPVTFYAAEAIGSRIEIERIDGTAYIVKASGKKSEARAGIKLSAKESLQTAMGSYAFLGIDDDKVIKVDELSQINIEKKNNKLSVNIEEGSIMFEVKGKIPQTCEMDLNASTMAMSIRGTAGVIGLRRIGDNIVSVTELVDGRVDMTYSDIAGKGRNFTLWGGETSLHKDGADSVERDLIDITEFPGFAAVELAGNPDLCKNMLEKSGLNTRWPIEHAAELLERGQAHNRENYYDVFEPGNVHSVKSLKGYVDSVMNIAVEEGLSEPAPPLPEPDDEPGRIVADNIPHESDPIPVDEHLKKYGQPIATATPTPEGYTGPNTISWDEYADRNKGNITSESTPTPHPYRDESVVINNSPAAITAPISQPQGNVPLLNSPTPVQDNGSITSREETPTPTPKPTATATPTPTPTATPTPTPEPTKEPEEDDDDEEDDDPTPTPGPTDVPVPTATPTPEPTVTPTPTPSPTPTEEPEEKCTVRFWDPKAEVPTIPVYEQEVKKNTIVDPPQGPVHEGFRFTGWDPDIENIPITEDIDCYATYEIAEVSDPNVVIEFFNAEASMRYGGDMTQITYDIIPSEYIHVYADHTMTIDDLSGYVEKNQLSGRGLYAYEDRNSLEGYLSGTGLDDVISAICEFYASSDNDSYKFFIYPFYKVQVNDASGTREYEAEAARYQFVEAAPKEGYRFSRWLTIPEESRLFENIHSQKLTFRPLTDVIITAEYVEKTEAQKYTVSFYRMRGGPDDYNTVELLGTEQVEKGANVSASVSRYEQQVREEKGGMTIIKINKGSYQNVTMDLDIYYY